MTSVNLKIKPVQGPSGDSVYQMQWWRIFGHFRYHVSDVTNKKWWTVFLGCFFPVEMGHAWSIHHENEMLLCHFVCFTDPKDFLDHETWEGNKKYPSCSYFRKIGRLVFTHPMAQDGWFAALLGNKHSTTQLLIGIKVIGRIASNGIPSLCPKEGSPDVVFFWGGEIQLSFCHCSASHITTM